MVVLISDCSSAIALVCRSTWAVTRLVFSDGQFAAAVVVCLLISHATASRLSGPPRRVQNSGSVPSPPRSASQEVSVATVGAVSGVQRSLRPLSQRWDKGRYLDVSVIPMSHM